MEADLGVAGKDLLGEMAVMFPLRDCRDLGGCGFMGEGGNVFKGDTGGGLAGCEGVKLATREAELVDVSFLMGIVV